VREKLDETAFSIVCRGYSGPIDASIKVLSWRPLDSLAKDLLRVGKKRTLLKHPSFVHLHEIFEAGPENDRRTIFVSEYINGFKLVSKNKPSLEKRFSIDEVAWQLKRMAQGCSCSPIGAIAIR
jgi:hypothetical protein